MITKTTLVSFLLPLVVSANAGTSTTILGAKANKVNDRTNTPNFIKFSSETQPVFSQFQSWSKENLKMRTIDALIENQSSNDKLGYTHHRFQQMYNNMPVEWSMYIIHEKNGLINSINGDYFANITPSNTVAINKNAALSTATNLIGAVKYKFQMPEEEAYLKKVLNKPDFSYDPKGDLVILPINGTFKIAYKFDIYADQPLGRWDVYVDAETNKVIEQISTIMNSDVNGTAHTKYSGIRTIKTDSLAVDTFRLRETTNGGGVQTLNLKTKTDITTAVDFLDSDNDWNNYNSKKDEIATDVHWAAEQTYDFYKTEMNRKSYDDKDSKLLSFAHYSSGYVNAMWNGYYMIYGDGDASNLPLTSIDICGHELTHGVTGNSAKLTYASESGALNESFSDIFGNTIERRAKPTSYSWGIGENINTVGGLRDMSNPKKFSDPNTYNGQFWIKTKGCVSNGGNDQCGVHTNSNVQNFWYYLLVEGGTGKNDLDSTYAVTGIGIDKAAQIAYRNLTVYLTPKSDYAEARFYSIQAAADLYGANSNEVQQTTNAWYAVGLGKKYSTFPISDFAVESNYCSKDSTFHFLNRSGSASSFKWNFGDGTTSTALSPTHKYTNTGTYNVTLIAINSVASDTLKIQQYVHLYSAQLTPALCTANGLNPYAKTGILNFKFADIDKTSKDGIADGVYNDYTCTRGNVDAGKSYAISIRTDSTIKQFARVWIDYNNDGTFTYPSELAFTNDTVSGTHTAIVHVPDTATAGLVRIKVVVAKSVTNTPNDPCATVNFGQIEEYGLYITNATGINDIRNITKLSISPNPSSGNFTIHADIKSGNKLQVSVINMLGQEIYKSLNDVNTGEYSKSLDLSSFPYGF
jgi:bacillolysin